MIHVSLGVTPNCKNPDSYGTICVRCNQCGRFNATESDCKAEKQAETVANTHEKEG